MMRTLWLEKIKQSILNPMGCMSGISKSLNGYLQLQIKTQPSMKLLPNSPLQNLVFRLLLADKKRCMTILYVYNLVQIAGSALDLNFHKNKIFINLASCTPCCGQGDHASVVRQIFPTFVIHIALAYAHTLAVHFFGMVPFYFLHSDSLKFSFFFLSRNLFSYTS